MNIGEYYGDDGQLYTISVDDDGERISVTAEGQDLGTISLRLVEVDDTGHFDYFHITHLQLRSRPRSGVGRRCLMFHKEIFQSRITAGAEGLKSDDGSHLTEGGPGFIAQMRKEGIVDSEDQG